MANRENGPVPTLLQLHKATCWVWLTCQACGNHLPVTIVPFMIRWGMHASSDRLRQSAVCSRCGRKGAALYAPSWTGSQTGFQTYARAVESVAMLDQLKAEYHNGSRPSGLVRKPIQWNR